MTRGIRRGTRTEGLLLATEDRRGAYTLGYADGFLLGCDEGDFDCSEVEDWLNEIYNEADVVDYGIELIPSLY